MRKEKEKMKTETIFEFYGITVNVNKDNEVIANRDNKQISLGTVINGNIELAKTRVIAYLYLTTKELVLQYGYRPYDKKTGYSF